jgi:hypothetical protein
MILQQLKLNSDIYLQIRTHKSLSQRIKIFHMHSNSLITHFLTCVDYGVH